MWYNDIGKKCLNTSTAFFYKPPLRKAHRFQSPLPVRFCASKHMEFQKIPIYCPKCGYRVMNYNGITTIPMQNTCNHCGAYIMFNPEQNKIKYLDKAPLRESSSGRRFY